jgi:hypothetical protein
VASYPAIDRDPFAVATISRVAVRETAVSFVISVTVEQTAAPERSSIFRERGSR